ncbi:MAG: SMP-30/gluconolactonase/LRE family protein [Acidiferrobacterales bacterium]|nr:SMP-30/gluconolactonase/LRE family protein [Acidiferrobacterales bacterium]
MTAIDFTGIRKVGQDLHRPECVLAMQDGSVLCSDWRGGVTIIWPSGEQQLVRNQTLNIELRPNGIGLLSDGTFLIAHLGETAGGLYRLLPDGNCEEVLTHLDGEQLPPSNYPHVDHYGRIWLTVSTCRVPRQLAYRADVSDGFIVLITEQGARVVADGIGYTNECCVHPDGNRLFVNETFARRTISYDISKNGDLSNRKTIAEYGHGTYPDGLVFDSDCNLWITSIISNRVICCTEDGRQLILIEDADRGFVETAEEAFHAGELNASHLMGSSETYLKNISSLAFGGPDRKTVYLGNLNGDSIFTFRSEVAGYAPPYQKYALQTPAQAS